MATARICVCIAVSMHRCDLVSSLRPSVAILCRVLCVQSVADDPALERLRRLLISVVANATCLALGALQHKRRKCF